MNHKQALFAAEYVKSSNATEAAKLAGYSPKTAYSQGQRLLKNAEIRKFVAEHRQEMSDKASLTLEWWIEKVMALAVGAVKERDRAKALDMLGKHLGAYVNELSIINKLSDEDLDRVLDKMLSKMQAQ